MRLTNSFHLLICMLLYALMVPKATTAEDGLEVPLSSSTNGSPILVNVQRGDHRYTFLVDTGASFTFLDQSTFKRLTTPYPHTKHTDTPRERFKEEIYNPGGLLLERRFPLQMQPLYLWDLSEVSNIDGFPLHGILGMDFLKSFRIAINSDHSTVSFTRRVSKTPGSKLPITLDSDGRPTVELSEVMDAHSARPESFLIDTGCAGTHGVIFRHSLFEELLADHRGMITSAHRRYTALGTFNSRSAIAMNLRLFAAHPRVTVDDTPTTSKPNILGMGYLTQFNVVIDFPNATLHVSPRKTPGMPLDLQDCSGFGFVREQGMILIKRVEPASPAFKADLRLDDAILAVNGVAGEKIDLYQLRFDLCQPGKEVKLKIRRNRREHSVTLHLEDWNKPVTAEDFE